MSALRTAIAAFAMGAALQAVPPALAVDPAPDATAPELPPVLVTPPLLIANCTSGVLPDLPDTDTSLARQFGLTACLANGVDFGKVFTDDRTRLNKFNQLVVAAQFLAQQRELGREMDNGEISAGFWVNRQPGGAYRFEWTTKRPASTVTPDNALPGDQRDGDQVISTLAGLIRPAAAPVTPPRLPITTATP